jgi:ubiquinone/menaquinone biosynthesis C-methylase UbiE
MTEIPQRALKQHFSDREARASPLNEALLELLPAELGDQRLRALGSTAFLTLPGLARWTDFCAKTAARNVCRAAALRMVDLGCGTGQLGRYLAESIQGDVVGIDNAEGAMHRSPCESGSGRFVCADAARLPFADASFDVALAIDSLHLCPDVSAVLAEVQRVLLAGGVLIGSAYRVADSLGKERPLRWWTTLLARTGLAVEHWVDVTPEWRRAMTAKHRRRWDTRHRLIDVFGSSALPVCQVSGRMLGEDGRPGFIETNARWEFLAAKR